jgi:hypothetical protein
MGWGLRTNDRSEFLRLIKQDALVFSAEEQFSNVPGWLQLARGQSFLILFKAF